MSHIRVIDDDDIVAGVEFYADGSCWRLVVSPGSELWLAAVMEVPNRTLVTTPVERAPWWSDEDRPFTAASLWRIADRFLAWRSALNPRFLERFTEEEFVLMAAGVCCWVVEFGAGRGIRWCREPREFKSRLAGNDVYCREHTQELREQYGINAALDVNVPGL